MLYFNKLDYEDSKKIISIKRPEHLPRLQDLAWIMLL